MPVVSDKVAGLPARSEFRVARWPEVPLETKLVIVLVLVWPKVVVVSAPRVSVPKVLVPVSFKADVVLLCVTPATLLPMFAEMVVRPEPPPELVMVPTLFTAAV